jgi:hypothetical protein
MITLEELSRRLARINAVSRGIEGKGDAPYRHGSAAIGQDRFGQPVRLDSEA